MTANTNLILASQVLEKIAFMGINEFCVCPGARNAPLVSLLAKEESFEKHYWFEERSAAFFALGRSRAANLPVAVVTTSGTAVAELLPAVMNAFYWGTPLLLITADRPRRFRGTGAPQTAEQLWLFGRYVTFQEDLAENEISQLHFWDRQGPAHLNICFEEPLQLPPLFVPINIKKQNEKPKFVVKEECFADQEKTLLSFLNKTAFPFVVVGELHEKDQEAVTRFLLELNAPVFLEGISGLREKKELAHLKISRTNKILETATALNYPIDAILRIGGVPTFRFWRDLESQLSHLEVCSISSHPFSGLSRGELIFVPLSSFFKALRSHRQFHLENVDAWISADNHYRQSLDFLFLSEPKAESSLVRSLSSIIPEKSLIYLGNSLPIREWDLAAAYEDKNFNVHASRGLNGIDGQISTFLGLCRSENENWAILGDLTTLYDMAGPWILKQLSDVNVRIVVINNSGGQIFSRMFPQKEFLHQHQLTFEPLAKMWELNYLNFTEIPENISNLMTPSNTLIELVPDEASTNRFWDKFHLLSSLLLLIMIKINYPIV